MAKSDDLKKALAGGTKRLSKKPITPPDETEKITKKIHGDDKETIRTTLDIPRNIHTAMKIRAIQEESSLKDYILRLAKQDLGLE